MAKGEETDAAVFGAAPGDLKINIPNLVKEADGRFYKIDEETGRAAVDAMVMLFIIHLIINILQVMRIIKSWVTILRIGL